MHDIRKVPLPMIIYLCTSRNDQTIGQWVAQWPTGLSDRLIVKSYESLPTYGSLPPAAYIFSDLEFLSNAQARLLVSLWETLAAEGPRVRLLNHPHRSLMRYDLLKALRQRGLLAYDLHRATDLPKELKFPVFVRIADDHHGSRTPPLHQRAHVEHAIISCVARGHDPAQILVVELCDVSAGTGIYHKYSAFRVGDRILPRHVLFGKDWMLKVAKRELDESALATELQYLRTNPHEAQLRQIFDVAHIDYGRIDYGLLDGKVQCWEINTNPGLAGPPKDYDPKHMPTQQLFLRMMVEALEAIDLPTSKEPALQIPYQLQMREAIGK